LASTARLSVPNGDSKRERKSTASVTLPDCGYAASMKFSIWIYLILNLGIACTGCTPQQQQQTETQAKQLSNNPSVREARQKTADAALAVQVESAIAAESGVNAFHIKAKVHAGAVVLDGTVPTAATKDVVVAAVRAVPGVKTVVDRITVRSS
jgi:osmotically-inducible protein OsmY